MIETHKMNVKQILRKHAELWEKAKRLNPAFAPQGSNLSWDDYYEAVAKAEDFEKREVSLR